MTEDDEIVEAMARAILPFSTLRSIDDETDMADARDAARAALRAYRERMVVL